GPTRSSSTSRTGARTRSCSRSSAARRPLRPARGPAAPGGPAAAPHPPARAPPPPPPRPRPSPGGIVPAVPDAHTPPFTRAVLALNGGTSDELILRLTTAMAKGTEAELIAVHVVEIDWTLPI